MYRNPPSESKAAGASNNGNLQSLVDPEWELIDPTPDPRTLFREFDKRFFWGRLASVEVRWSPRMTLCAGICHYEGRGGLCSIRLSQPLLKLRPRRDLVQTLLHEMIHAYLFITCNDRDRDGHGPQFCEHMARINAESGANITIYHNFTNEVKFYQRHWWRCEGQCRSRPPFYGYVKRAMNRAPGPHDFWWSEHQRTCGGRYIKVKEPESGQSRPSSTGSMGSAARPALADIRTYTNSTSLDSRADTTAPTSDDQSPNKQLRPSTSATADGSGHCLGGHQPTGKGPVFRVIPGVGRVPIRIGGMLTAASVATSQMPDGEPSDPSDSDFEHSKHKRSRLTAGLEEANVGGRSQSDHPKVAVVHSSPKLKPHKKVVSSPQKSGPVTGPMDRYVRTPEEPVGRCASTVRHIRSIDGPATFTTEAVKPLGSNTADDTSALLATNVGQTDDQAVRRLPAGVSLCLCPICGDSIKQELINAHVDGCIAKSAEHAVPTKAATMTTEVAILRCPVCGEDIEHLFINDHLDTCLSRQGCGGTATEKHSDVNFDAAYAISQEPLHAPVDLTGESEDEIREIWEHETDDML